MRCKLPPPAAQTLSALDLRSRSWRKTDSRLSAPALPEDAVAVELKKYRALKVGKSTIKKLASTSGAVKWRLQNKTAFSILHKAAMVCLTLTATTAHQERDFCAAKDLLRPKRSTRANWMVEVQLLLKHNASLIRADLSGIKELNAETAQKSIPQSLKGAQLYMRKIAEKSGLLPAQLLDAGDDSG